MSVLTMVMSSVGQHLNVPTSSLVHGDFGTTSARTSGASARRLIRIVVGFMIEFDRMLVSFLILRL